jgi:nicotinamide-nucleotide amidase
MPTDADLAQLAVKVGAHLLGLQRKLVTAESCTGGWIGKVLTDVSGSSAWYLGGVVAYDNALKQSLLGVSAATLRSYGAVSEQTAREMALGALQALGGHVAASVTGIAGPDGGQPDKPVGTVWFGWAWRDAAVKSRAALATLAGDRESVRRQAVERALAEIFRLGL